MVDTRYTLEIALKNFQNSSRSASCRRDENVNSFGQFHGLDHENVVQLFFKGGHLCKLSLHEISQDIQFVTVKCYGLKWFVLIYIFSINEHFVRVLPISSLQFSTGSDDVSVQK